MIQQANPGAGYHEHSEAFLSAIRKVLESGWYILGQEVEAFEAEFAHWCGAEYGIACANGTDAIELALRSLGSGPGKVVFTVSHTAVATVAAIERTGAIPWMVDIDPLWLTMCPQSLEDAINDCRRLRPELEALAVVPVHIYGQAAEMDPILDIAARENLVVVEDCAQSHGTLYHDKKTGTMGHAGAFSLYPTKNLGAFGDAGIVVTDDRRLYESMRSIRQYGWEKRYISEVSGINSRMDPLQAAMLRVKLPNLDKDVARRRNIAAQYDKLLASFQGQGIMEICSPAAYSGHAYHQYVIRTKYRDDLAKFCAANGVGTAIHYPVPVHKQPAYQDRGKFPLSAKGLPNTEIICNQILSLPMYPQLTEQDVAKVAETIIRWGSQGSAAS